MKKERIVRYSLADLPAGRIDAARVDGMSDEQIEAIARADADNPPATDQELAQARMVVPAGSQKVGIFIRLDADVVEFYKAGGPGYQARINADLREVMRRRPRARGRGLRTARDVIRRPARVRNDRWQTREAGPPAPASVHAA
jgi:uncharacterized protein (DUF4415 family)